MDMWSLTAKDVLDICVRSQDAFSDFSTDRVECCGGIWVRVDFHCQGGVTQVLGKLTRHELGPDGT